MDRIENLEKFILDKDLKTLEQITNKFNIFDCLKLTRTEIRHSNFLGWLLDPNETHNFNDYFLKEFLKNILLKCKKGISEIDSINLKFESVDDKNVILEEKYNLPNIFDIDSWDMTDCELFRELENIDLLLVDNKNKFVLVIENKIDSNQHDNQLSRYREYVDQTYSSEVYKKMFVYLKPQKEQVEKPYLFVDYALVKFSLDELLKTKSDKTSNEIIMAINHYKEILERDIMQKDDEISKLCIQIYKNHKKAIDLINKYGTPQKELNSILREVLEEKDYIQEIYPESNINTLCLPIAINDLDKIKFGNIGKYKNYIGFLKFVNFRTGFDCVWLEILFSPTKNIKDNDKFKIIADNLAKSDIILKSDKSGGWAWAEPITIITLEEYCSYNSREDIKQHISKRLDEEKSNYIDKLANAINSAIDKGLLD